MLAIARRYRFPGLLLRPRNRLISNGTPRCYGLGRCRRFLILNAKNENMLTSVLLPVEDKPIHALCKDVTYADLLSGVTMRYELLNKTIFSVGLAGSVTAATIVKTELEQLQFHPIAVIVLAFLLLNFLVGWLKDALAEVVAAIPSVRRRLLGRYFVEGTWLNQMTFPNGKRVYGVVRIEPERESLRYAGKNYNREGDLVGSFESKLLSIEWPKMKFTCDPTPPMQEYLKVVGSVSLSFEERDDHPPKLFTAYCDAVGQGEGAQIQAWKIDDLQILNALSSPQRRQAVIREQIAIHFTLTPGESQKGETP